MKALEIVRQQRTNLCDEGNQLADRLMELYDLGIFLDIIPQDPQLSQLLLSTREIFILTFESFHT